MILSSQDETMLSSTLLRTGVSDIGRRSESIDLGLATFGTGITSAHFHNDGMVPCETLALNMEQIGPARMGAQDFSTQLGMSSGPVALWIFNFASSDST